jgi:PAS domain S-box-containing protein
MRKWSIFKSFLTGRSVFVRYGAAAVAVALAYASRAVLDPVTGTTYPYGTFLLAALICGWWAGLGPGLSCAVLGAVVARYFLSGPGWRYLFSGGGLVGLLFYLLISSVLIVLFHRLRTARSHLETEVERLAKARAESAKRGDLLDLAQDAIISLDARGAIDFWNRGAEIMYGWSAAEALGRVPHELFHTESGPSFQEIRGVLLQQGAWQGELVQTRKNGGKIVVSSRWALKQSGDKERQALEPDPPGFLEIARDITERKRLEEQLRETARMESLGLLAGGIAHDFNNLLVGVIGNASLVLDRLGEGNPQRPLLQQLLCSADRMAYLTRELLAYAGKGKFVTRPVKLSAIIQEQAVLLQTAVPKNVNLEFALPPVPAIEADLAQMQQVIANLVINAAEAIDDRPGTVLVTTGIKDLDESYRAVRLNDFPITPGRFVMVQVEDTGCGMDAATQARIFDPFFTTKFLGRGLGLSAVVGIVRGHRGALEVTSAPGCGSTFTLYFPAIGGA